MADEDEEEFQWLQNPRRSFEDWQPPPALIGTAFAKRRLFFEQHASCRNGFAVCPACGYPTLVYRNSYDCCFLCDWEDDGQDDPWADQINGGPNDHSLTQARINVEETSSVWSFAEADEFGDYFRERLFSAEAQRRKLALRKLMDDLMTLETIMQVEQQWILIKKQASKV